MSNVIIPGRVVVCAACKYEDLIIAGARHFDSVMHSQLRALANAGISKEKLGKPPIQGFIDQFGKFMDRVEALEVAEKAGQLNTRRSKTNPTTELFSEDLY